GLGKADKLSPTELRIQVRKALLSSYLKSAKNVEIVPHAADDATVTAIIEGASIGTYVWDKYKSKPKDDKTVKDKKITIATAETKALRQSAAICAGVNLTRDLVNDNADTVTSDFLESTVKGLVKGHKEISLEILNEKELKRHGLNLHL